MLLGVPITALCVVVNISIHLSALRLLWRYGRPRLESLRGAAIIFMLLGCMAAHLVEIAVFAFGLFAVAAWEGDADLKMQGWRHHDLDLWYYSAAFYTSLGADRPPTAGLRVLVTSEALTGLILITWTASFLFLLMQSSWGPEAKEKTNGGGGPPPSPQSGFVA